MAVHFRLRENTQIGARLRQSGGDVAEFGLTIALNDDCMACRDGTVRDRQGNMFLRNRQTENRTRMQREFA